MRGSTRQVIKDYGLTVVIAVGVAFFIRSYIVEAYRIPSHAMKPTLEAGDTLFVWKHLKSADRGEIIVFRSNDLDYIRRVVGIAGDTVAVRKGQVYLNGKSILATPSPTPVCAEEKIPDSSEYSICFDFPPIEDFGPEKVPEGSLFVVGDFRSKIAQDTKKHKSWGIIPISSVKGKAAWIWLSVDPNRDRTDNSSILPKIRWDRMFRRLND